MTKCLECGYVWECNAVQYYRGKRNYPKCPKCKSIIEGIYTDEEIKEALKTWNEILKENRRTD